MHRSRHPASVSSSEELFFLSSYFSLKVYSEVTTVGWFINDEFIAKHGDIWPEELCKEWYDQEMADRDWLEDLIPCPTTRGHAYTDYGNFIIDAECEPEIQLCPTLAIECVIGVHPK